MPKEPSSKAESNRVFLLPLCNSVEIDTYKEILQMIEGEALGQPLLEQEYECLEEAYSVGVEISDLTELGSYCETFFTIVPIENLQDPCKPQTIL